MNDEFGTRRQRKNRPSVVRSLLVIAAISLLASVLVDRLLRVVPPEAIGFFLYRAGIAAEFLLSSVGFVAAALALLSVLRTSIRTVNIVAAANSTNDATTTAP